MRSHCPREGYRVSQAHLSSIYVCIIAEGGVERKGETWRSWSLTPSVGEVTICDRSILVIDHSFVPSGESTQRYVPTLAKHTFSSLSRRLSTAGFKKDFVRRAILPDWWDKSCEQDQSLLTDLEIRVARFLELPLSVVRDPTAPLSPLQRSEVKLRRVRYVEQDRLAPAIHAALQIAGAVNRCVDSVAPDSGSIPVDGLSWRDEISRDSPHVSLQDILTDLWARGIPVVHIDTLPTPGFQGLACIVEGRPTILLGQRYDEPGRTAFIVAHEFGHISSGDCAPEHPVVDEEAQVMDGSCMEKSADRYATQVLVGENAIPEIVGNDYRELAQNAANLESERGADAGAIIYAWASRARDYSQASMAVKALYRGSGALRLLRRHFESNVNIEDASETDRALLGCVLG